MKKVVVLAIVLVSAIGAIAIISLVSNSLHFIGFNDLKGNILVSKLIFDSATRQKTDIPVEGDCFSIGDNCILNISNTYSEPNQTILTEYNILTGEKNEILRINSAPMTSLRIIPNQNKISVLIDGKLYAIDLNTKDIDYLCDISSYSNFDFALYDWDYNGESLYLNMDQHDGKLIRFNVNTHKLEALFDGYNPALSKDGNCIAYTEPKSDNITVKSFVTGEVWRCTVPSGLYSSRPERYTFSPNGNYLAVYSSSSTALFSNSDLWIVDYKTDKFFNLQKFTDISAYGQNLDWR